MSNSAGAMLGGAAPMSEAKTAYTTSALAEQVAGELRGSASLEIVGINNLEDALADQIMFITDAAHAERWADAQAGAAGSRRRRTSHRGR